MIQHHVNNRQLLDRLRAEEFPIPLAFADETERTDSIPLLRLLEGDTLREQIEKVARKKDSDNLTAAASLFQKRYAGTLLAAVLTPMSTFGVGFLAHFDETEVVLEDGLPVEIVLRGNRPPLVFPTRLPPSMQRMAQENEWTAVEQVRDLRWPVLQAAFNNNLGPLIYKLASEFKLAPRVMWGNIGNYVGYLYDLLRSKEAFYAQAAQDRDSLLHSVGFDGPPLGKTFTEVWLPELDPPQWVRVRSSCCMWYKFPGNKPCYTCPLLCNEERAEVLSSHKAK
ncbi:MAG TPA: ferric iron reductase [Bacilli bacterium]|nr:ferric iron reductase [Bacilli bacterium]